MVPMRYEYCFDTFLVMPHKGERVQTITEKSKKYADFNRSSS